MSFGDLIGLLLFLVFIVLPAVARAQQRRGGAGGPVAGPRPGAPRAGGPPAGAPPSAAPGGGQRQPGTVIADGGQGASPKVDDDLARRLAEARRRVREAMEQRNAGAGAPSVGPPPTPAPLRTVGGTSDPRARAARPLVAQNLDDGLMSTPLEIGPALSTPRAPNAKRAIRHNLRVEAPPVEVERVDGRPKGPGASVIPALRLDASGVRDGFVWHQVLGAPRSRRRLGGGPFPER